MIKSFEELHCLNESNSKFRSTPIDRKLTKLVDIAGGLSTPFILLAISNKKLVNAVVIRDHNELVPQYRAMVKKNPKAEIRVEDHDGQGLPPVHEQVTPSSIYKKGNKLTIDMGDGPEEVEVMVPPGKSITLR